MRACTTLICLVGVTLSLGGRGSLLAQTSTSGPLEDAAITESAPDNNLGRSWLAVGADEWGFRSRTLMRFGMPNAPANSSVTGAKLVLVVTQVPKPGTGAIEFSLHRVTRGWWEGCLGNPVRDDWGDEGL